MTDDGECARIRSRLTELARLHEEAWLGGLSVGGGLAFHEQQTTIEDEVTEVRARQAQLGCPE